MFSGICKDQQLGMCHLMRMVKEKLVVGKKHGTGLSRERLGICHNIKMSPKISCYTCLIYHYIFSSVKGGMRFIGLEWIGVSIICTVYRWDCKEYTLPPETT